MKLMKKGILVLAGLLLVGTTGALHAAADGNIRILKNEFFEAAEVYLASHEPWKSSEVNISRKYVKELEVPADAEISLEVKGVSCSKPWGKLAVPVTVVQKSSKGIIKRRIQTYLNVDMRTTVAVAVRNIRHNEAITAKNVRFIKMALSSAPRNAVITREAVGNARAVGAIMAGKIITASVIEEVPVIKKGQRISLVAARNGIRVAAAGTAREDGYVGERIRVMNDKSQKLLVGTVRHGGVVEIAN